MNNDFRMKEGEAKMKKESEKRQEWNNGGNKFGKTIRGRIKGDGEEVM